MNICSSQNSFFLCCAPHFRHILHWFRGHRIYCRRKSKRNTKTDNFKGHILRKKRQFSIPCSCSKRILQIAKYCNMHNVKSIRMLCKSSDASFKNSQRPRIMLWIAPPATVVAHRQLKHKKTAESSDKRTVPFLRPLHKDTYLQSSKQKT